jgi:hypothetical protein
MEEQHNRCSPWGGNDHIGTMNYVIEMLVRLFRSVKHGIAR